MVAPMAGQVMLLAMLLAFRQWMFAAMIVPSLLGCMASLALALPRRSQDAQGGAMPAGGRLVDASSSGAAMAVPTPDPARLQRMPARHLELLLGMHREADRLPWRTVARRWLHPFSMNVPIGLTERDVVCLDLQRQGPHALVAGTTGSGKSVLLQSWCLALAARNPPERLQFVFLDFKGGTAFRPLERLPHCVGSVCDLDLQHAVRALHALDLELKRRERLVAEQHAQDISALRFAPPRLVVVIDEFHALRDQLPDVVNRIVHIASLGRSLGMHVIACTQHPAGQVSSDMKANMTLGLCLRVRDAMQSVEILGSGVAASIPPSLPGVVYCNDGEGVEAWRCAATGDIDRMVDAISLAARCHGSIPAPALFSAPLPRVAKRLPAANHAHGMPFALADNGVTLQTATLPLFRGNIGIIGPHGRGKTTLLAAIARWARFRAGEPAHVRWTSRNMGGYATRDLPAPTHGDDVDVGTGQEPIIGIPDEPRPIRIAAGTADAGTAGEAGTPACADSETEPHRRIWIVDDADTLFDPFCADPLAAQLREALADHTVTVVFAVESSRNVRIPDHCAIRVVFPTADKATDQMNGIPADIWASFGPDALTLPGRAVFIDHAQAVPVQCVFGDDS